MIVSRQFVSLLVAGTLVLLSAAWMESTSWADRLNFYDGVVVTGHVTEVAGDIIRYRQGLLREFTTRRLRLSDRQDIVTTWGDKRYIGEIHYIDGTKLEIVTSTGRQILFKATVKDIEMGSRRLPKNNQWPLTGTAPNTTATSNTTSGTAYPAPASSNPYASPAYSAPNNMASDPNPWDHSTAPEYPSPMAPSETMQSQAPHSIPERIDLESPGTAMRQTPAAKSLNQNPVQDSSKPRVYFPEY